MRRWLFVVIGLLAVTLAWLFWEPSRSVPAPALPPAAAQGAAAAAGQATPASRMADAAETAPDPETAASLPARPGPGARWRVADLIEKVERFEWMVLQLDKVLVEHGLPPVPREAQFRREDVPAAAEEWEQAAAEWQAGMRPYRSAAGAWLQERLKQICEIHRLQGAAGVRKVVEQGAFLGAPVHEVLPDDTFFRVPKPWWHQQTSMGWGNQIEVRFLLPEAVARAIPDFASAEQARALQRTAAQSLLQRWFTR